MLWYLNRLLPQIKHIIYHTSTTETAVLVPSVVYVALSLQLRQWISKLHLIQMIIDAHTVSLREAWSITDNNADVLLLLCVVQWR